LPSFWYQIHVDLITGSTADVYCYPQNMRALSSLNLASNHLGLLASDDGWTMNESGAYCSPEGIWQGSTKPDGVEFKPLGVIVLAGAIKDNGTLTSLNLSSNDLQAQGAKIVAEAIEVLIMRLRSFWYNFRVHLTTG
jgi:hypothetical protein